MIPGSNGNRNVAFLQEQGIICTVIERVCLAYLFFDDVYQNKFIKNFGYSFLPPYNKTKQSLLVLINSKFNCSSNVTK